MNIANEIINEEVQRALRTRWQAWLWIIAILAFSGWLLFKSDVKWAGLVALISGLTVWRQIGIHFATVRIRQAAQEKANRLAATHA